MDALKKSILLFALAFAVLGLVLAPGCTQAGPSGQANNTTINGTKGAGADANTDGYMLIAKSFDNLALLGDYSITINDSKETYNTVETVERAGGLSHVRLASPVDTKDIYWDGNSTTYCIRTAEKPDELCFAVTNESQFYPEVLGYASMFYNDNYIRGSKRENQIFQASYARTFVANLTNETYNGFPCTQTAFTTDYKKMTVDQLDMLGLTSDTFQFNDNFLTVMCIDQKGLPIFLNVSYREVYDNLTRSTVREVVAFKESEVGIAMPQVNSNESAFGAEYNDAIASLKAYATCFRVKNEADRNDCYKGSAFDSKDAKICAKVTDAAKHDQCVIAIMSKTMDPKLCAMTGVFADDCYAEAARVTENSTYCLSVKNESVQKLCLDYLNGTYQPKPDCATDSDCAPAGCSSQLCAPKGADITTTCEWRNEYSCYGESFASCGCNAGVCGWKQNDSLTQCIAQKSNETAAAPNY
ncbi:MAG: hypothetical protein WC506_02355 [Candidatus Micrarchaeia archaeon]